jgi:hypothetical protein
MMKANNAKVQKKAAKKDLENSLAEKFLEVVKSLGHDAANISEDISIASKAFAKKLLKSVIEVKDSSKSKADSTKTKKQSKEVKQVKKTLEKAIKNLNPVAQSVKVVAIVSAENAAKAIAPLVKPVKIRPVKSTKETKKIEDKNSIV